MQLSGLALHPPDSRPAPPAWTRRLTGPWAAAAILAVFWLFMLASLREKGITFDEIGHVTAGYTYWRFHDYRLDPENGILPQRVAGLPFLWGGYDFPSLDSEAWRRSDFVPLGEAWFFGMGHDAAAMLARGRAVCGLTAVALGALVWFWSRRLHGPVGGMLSLILFVLSPSILANGALMTSDATSALFFLAACLGLWAVLQRVSAGRVLPSALALGGLFVAKASAVLILPMALIMVAVRLADGRPLPVAGAPRPLLRRRQQAAAFAAAAVVHAAVVVLVIWASYSFRFSAFASATPGRDRMTDTWEKQMDRPFLPALLTGLRLDPADQARVGRLLDARGIPMNEWTQEAVDVVPEIERLLPPEPARRLGEAMAAPPADPILRALDWIYRRRLLPQGYLSGLARVAGRSQLREAFLNGAYSVSGWKSFFPYTVLVKTPLAFFGIVLLAAAAAAARRPTLRSCYDTVPLWTLLAVYWGVFIFASLNIGHRHILATYPPLFVLSGAAAGWLTARTRAVGAALVALVVLLALEVLPCYPNYLAYFNAIAGGPSQAYRHLVDSSLDWGQDLPGVGRSLAAHTPAGAAYLAYFGMGDPDYYRIPARLLYSYGFTLARPLPLPLRVVPASAGDLDRVANDFVRRNPDLELVATADDRGRKIAVFLEKPQSYRLAGGTYFISATLLESLEFTLDRPWGPWNDRYEATYQRLRALVQPFLSDDPAARLDALGRGTIGEWMQVFSDYEQYRFARLAAYLRQREPDGSVGYSILVYRLSDADVSRALDGPPPERGPDVMRLLEASPR